MTPQKEQAPKDAPTTPKDAALTPVPPCMAQIHVANSLFNLFMTLNLSRDQMIYLSSENEAYPEGLLINRDGEIMPLQDGAENFPKHIKTVGDFLKDKNASWETTSLVATMIADMCSRIARNELVVDSIDNDFFDEAALPAAFGTSWKLVQDRLEDMSLNDIFQLWKSAPEDYAWPGNVRTRDSFVATEDLFLSYLVAAQDGSDKEKLSWETRQIAKKGDALEGELIREKAWFPVDDGFLVLDANKFRPLPRPKAKFKCNGHP